MTEALIVSQLLLWMGFLALTLVLAVMLRQLGVLFERVAPAGALAMNARLSVGDEAPRFSVKNLAGDDVDIGGTVDADRSTLLFFLSSECPVCKELTPALLSFMRRERQNLTVLFIGSAQEHGHARVLEVHGIPEANYVVSDEVGMAYAVSKLPYAVLIDESGRIASFGLVNNREHIESLLEAKNEEVASIQDYMKKTA